MPNSEQTSLLKRSILWLCVLLAVVGITYYYEEDLLKEGLRAITASNTPEETPIYNVNTNKKQISISFDVTGNDNIGEILDILNQNNVKASFFVTGNWVKTHPDEVKILFSNEHDLGNYSENHTHMSRLSNSEIHAEIAKVTERVKELTGFEMKLFRPPYGDYDNNLIAQARACGYTTVLWSINSLDWKDYGENAVVDTILNHENLKNGAIILMHIGAKYTAASLPKVIKGLQEKGYEIVPISLLIKKETTPTENGTTQEKKQHFYLNEICNSLSVSK